MKNGGVCFQHFPKLLSEEYQSVLQELEGGHITVQQYYDRRNRPLWSLPDSINLQDRPFLRVRDAGVPFKRQMARKSVGQAAPTLEGRRGSLVESEEDESGNVADVSSEEATVVRGNVGRVAGPDGTSGRAVSQVSSGSGGPSQLALPVEAKLPAVKTGGNGGVGGSAVVTGTEGEGSEPEDINRLLSKLSFLSCGACIWTWSDRKFCL